MKKRIICLVFVLLVVLSSLTGCVRVRATINVSSTGKVDYSILVAAKSENTTESILPQESIDAYKDLGYIAEEYSEDGYKGVILTKLDSDSKEENVLGNVVTIKQEGSKFIIDIPWTDNSATSFVRGIIADGGFVELVVKLPTRAYSHNATKESADGRTLTWDLLEFDGKESIHVEYSVIPLAVLWLMRISVIVVGCGLVSSLIFCIVYFIKKKKAGKQGDAPGEEPVTEPGETEPDEKPKELSGFDRLREYKKLLDEGVITEEDYAKKKQEFLDSEQFGENRPED